MAFRREAVRVVMPSCFHGKMVLRAEIERVFLEVYRQQVGSETPALSDDLVLLKSGLDSLGFALLVARLDEELGLDPFSASEVAYYPRTFGEFVSFYENNCR